ncbi:xanthine dehydrogenase [Bordetella ansorpii]|uniref:Xanthine dehydrogenase n=1 Tax=Bordetella ansorpii TaxID=288768 RepID=A0A157Q7G4_9BORD|nr:xanthine dehydrogenase family protein subunit M [Bordetella ansorpii]SAI41865.1 xanthine dehydrogenase [Bordetella ansorpii]
MRPFEYLQASDPADGVAQASRHQGARFLAGGTNLVDLMKEDIEQPTHLVDISRLALRDIAPGNAGLAIGALATNADTANHNAVRTQYPLLSQAILAGASGQIRNMATNGGNLLQRTRCQYFYDISMPCNKRRPGSGCAAREGLNRIHAVFGWSEACVAAYPGDMANALVALDARVRILRRDNTEATMPLASLYRLPGSDPAKDTNLAPGELIVGIDLPAASERYAAHSHYLKVRDRSSYAFAMVSVAAALDIKDGVIQSARVVLGGVAHMPWRVEDAESLLAGGPPGEARFQQAADRAFQDARPLSHNQYKIELGKRAVVRALTLASRPA